MKTIIIAPMGSRGDVEVTLDYEEYANGRDNVYLKAVQR